MLEFVEHLKLPDSVRQDFLQSYEGDRLAESTRFVRSCKDELPVNGEYLHERLLHSKPDYVNAVHVAWADAAVDYARLLIDWRNGG